MYTLDFILLFNDIVDNLNNLSQEELTEQLDKLYSYINLPKEISLSNELKTKVLKTIKEIITLYKYKDMMINKSRGNYLRGNGQIDSANPDFFASYNSLRLDLDDFGISKFNIVGSKEGIKQQIYVYDQNFFPVTFTNPKLCNKDYKITTRERKIFLKRTGLLSNQLEYTDTHVHYIDSIVDKIYSYSYIIKNVKVEDYKELGLNEMLDIVYYQIEQAHLKPTSVSTISRSHKYPEYVEVEQNGKKFLTTINVLKGINSLTSYNVPVNGSITRDGGNIYTTYMLSGNSIESKQEKLSEDLQDEEEKINFVKYYRYVNK